MYKVVIVEDEAIIQKGLVYLVNWAELECNVVEICSDGNEGLSAIKRICPDLILTDVRMPMMDGLEMLRQARESIKNNLDFEAIIISGYDDFSYAKSAIDLRVCAYILKPINQNELIDKIKIALSCINERRKNKITADIKEYSLYYQYANEFITEFQDSKNKYHSLVGDVVNYIVEHYNEDVRTMDICNIFHISKTGLNNIFKKETGRTIIVYLNQYRISKSITLMKTTNLRLNEIAYQIGYSDYKYFFEIFKKYIGVSPKKFIALFSN
ncbi:putative response regulatory protein [Bacteroidia bacterium]|nr:putative response regulatory protein [Bacteroidia bacterium]